MNNLSTKWTKTMKTNVTNTASINFHSRKSTRLLYFTYDFISDHINIDNYCYLLSFCKTKRYSVKWKIMNFKKFVLKIVIVIISMT